MKNALPNDGIKWVGVDVQNQFELVWSIRMTWGYFICFDFLTFDHHDKKKTIHQTMLEMMMY